MCNEMILCFEVTVYSQVNDCPNVLVWIGLNIRVLDFDMQKLIKVTFMNSDPVTR